MPGTRVMDSPTPKMIYDMYGFPEELYQITYNAPGLPHYARLTRQLIGDGVQVDNSWGLDHGTRSVSCRIYPKADILVFQLSVDRSASAEEHFEIGWKLRALRKKGVLILGSRNIVHNLARVNWNMDSEYPWAEKFDHYIKSNVLIRNDENVIHFEQTGASASLVFTA